MNKYIFLRNKKYRPSSYYRIYQYLEKSNANIIEYETNLFYKVKKDDKLLRVFASIIFQLIPGYTRRIYNITKILVFDKNYIVYVQRSIFPKVIGPLGKTLLKLLIKNSKKVYWDFDDNIIEVKEVSNYEKEILEENSTIITVGNEFLKSKISEKFKCKVKLIPTTDKSIEIVDVNRLNKFRMISYDKSIKLVWVGTSGNLKHLYCVLPWIESAARDLAVNFKKKIILNVVCNEELKYECEFLKIKNIKWDREIAIEIMEKSHIGIMPLQEDNFTKGKCGFKAVQNIGFGLPTIVSDVGFNSEVIENGVNGFLVSSEKEWIDSIKLLSTDKYEWTKFSQNAREQWLKKFDSRQISRYILNLLEIKSRY